MKEVKKDRLEQFIETNREAFDLYEPNPNLWLNIEKQIGPAQKPTLKTGRLLWRAAAAIAIISLSVATVEFLHNNNIKLLSFGHQEMEIPELKEAEIYYQRELNNKMEEIMPVLSSYPGLDKELEKDMSELDSMYQSLKKRALWQHCHR
ncbi:MAG: hypothetical protein HC896_12395 [Bacteroidales bacterium]|nr:hypothetical protein [Bacteroidales bacterium]